MYEAVKPAEYRVEFERSPGKYTPTFWGSFSDCLKHVMERRDADKFQHYQIWQGQKLVQFSIEVA